MYNRLRRNSNNNNEKEKKNCIHYVVQKSQIESNENAAEKESSERIFFSFEVILKLIWFKCVLLPIDFMRLEPKNNSQLEKFKRSIYCKSFDRFRNKYRKHRHQSNNNNHTHTHKSLNKHCYFDARSRVCVCMCLRKWRDIIERMRCWCWCFYFCLFCFGRLLICTTISLQLFFVLLFFSSSFLHHHSFNMYVLTRLDSVKLLSSMIDWDGSTAKGNVTDCCSFFFNDFGYFFFWFCFQKISKYSSHHINTWAVTKDERKISL